MATTAGFPAAQNHRMACCTEMNMVPNCNFFMHAASRTLLDKVVKDVGYPDSDDDVTEADVKFNLEIRQQKRRNTLERRRKTPLHSQGPPRPLQLALVARRQNLSSAAD